MKGRRVSGASASLGRPVVASLVFRDAGVTFRLRCLHSSSVPSHFSPLLKKHLRTIWKLNESRVTWWGLRVRRHSAPWTQACLSPVVSQSRGKRWGPWPPPTSLRPAPLRPPMAGQEIPVPGTTEREGWGGGRYLQIHEILSATSMVEFSLPSTIRFYMPKSK